MIWNIYELKTHDNITENDIMEKIGGFCYSVILEDMVEGERLFEIISFGETELLEYVYTLKDYTLLKYERPSNDEIFDQANENGGLDDIDKILIESNIEEEELNKLTQLKS